MSTRFKFLLYCTLIVAFILPSFVIPMPARAQEATTVTVTPVTIAANIRSGDWLSLAGSVLFLAACVVFVVPQILTLHKK